MEFAYGSADLFFDLSLVIDTEWRTGLVGRNGRGKTTLLKLINRDLEIQAGDFTCPVETRYYPGAPIEGATTQRVARQLVAPFEEWQKEMDLLLASEDEGAMDAYSNLLGRFQDARGYEIDGLIETEFEKIGLPHDILDKPFDELSLGQQTRVQIVALFLSEGCYALIDEPTNHLDIPGREILASYLASQQGFLLISHDRSLLDACTDHIVSINKSDVRLNRGNWSTWHADMSNELLSEGRTRHRLEAEIKQLSRAALARRAGADRKESEKYGDSHADTGFIGHKSAKQMKRAIGAERRIEKQISEKESLLANQEKKRVVTVASDSVADKQLLNVNNLSIEFSGIEVVHNLSFSIGAGDRVALTGPNGCGKSSVLNAIDGLIEFAGSIAFGTRSISRAWQHPVWVSGMLRGHLDEAGLDETRFRQLLGSLDVRGEVFEQPLDSFSQGQLKKVDLTRSMLEPAELLLWDEPLNYLDVDTREMLEEGILDGGATMLFVEHDQRFIENIATAVVKL